MFVFAPFILGPGISSEWLMPQALPLFIFFGCFPIAIRCRKQLAQLWLAGKM
jgi:hypothetical protein